MRIGEKVCWLRFLVFALLLAPLGLSASSSDIPVSVVGKYNGPGGCAASSCHGSVQPKQVTRILQNEYSIWIAQDKHAKAFSVLSNPVSVRMGKIFKIGAPAQAREMFSLPCAVGTAGAACPDFRTRRRCELRILSWTCLRLAGTAYPPRLAPRKVGAAWYV